MKISIAMATALALLTTTAPLAADLEYTPAPVVSSANYDWSGFYAGVHGGMGNGASIADSGASETVEFSGAIYGVQAGYNWQVDSFVFGIEGSLSGANISGSEPCTNPAFTCTGNLDAYVNVVARAGMAFDNVLLYAKAGVAHAAARADVDPAFPGYSFGTTGYSVGGGVELGITNALSARLDYSYMAFQTATAPAGTLNVGATTLDPHAHAITVGLNYRF